MGASLIHGQRLLKHLIRYSDGSEGEELFAEGGAWEFPAYSSVARMIDFCVERGVPASDWPIFYDVWEGDVDLKEIASRCERLRSSLLQLPESEFAAVPWLSSVRAWLIEGKLLAVFE